MKTFSEACREIMQPGSLREAVSGENKEANIKRCTLNESHRELLEEIAASAEYQSLVVGLKWQLIQGVCSPDEMLFSLFGYGIAVGMVMERSDVGVAL